MLSNVTLMYFPRGVITLDPSLFSGRVCNWKQFKQSAIITILNISQCRMIAYFFASSWLSVLFLKLERDWSMLWFHAARIISVFHIYSVENCNKNTCYTALHFFFRSCLLLKRSNVLFVFWCAEFKYGNTVKSIQFTYLKK